MNFESYRITPNYLQNDRIGAMKYFKRRNELLEKFRKDLENKFEMLGHPKRDKIWSIASEYSHDKSLEEIFEIYSDLMEIIK